MKTDGHIETPECGFDRNASHSAGRYVCTCGYEPINAGTRGSDTERVGKVQPSHAAPAPNDLAAMEAKLLKAETVIDHLESGAAADEERIAELELHPAFQLLIFLLEEQLAEAKSIALDAQSESAAYQAMQERAQGDNATLQEEIFRLMHNQQLQDSTTAAVIERAEKAEAQLERQIVQNNRDAERFREALAENTALRDPVHMDAERYRWFRLQGLWDSEHFPWPDGFEYPEGISEAEMLDAAIDAVRKA